MATNPIYVETEEEIPELVERLRRYHGEDTMLVLPMRSRIGQSRFNFQLLRNYSARLGKRVTVVCDDPAVQKMASESGFAVFGAVGPQGEGIPSEAEVAPPIRRWWQRKEAAPTTHVGVGAPPGQRTKRPETNLRHDLAWTRFQVRAAPPEHKRPRICANVWGHDRALERRPEDGQRHRGQAGLGRERGRPYDHADRELLRSVRRSKNPCDE